MGLCNPGSEWGSKRDREAGHAMPVVREDALVADGGCGAGGRCATKLAKRRRRKGEEDEQHAADYRTRRFGGVAKRRKQGHGDGDDFEEAVRKTRECGCASVWGGRGEDEVGEKKNRQD